MPHSIGFETLESVTYEHIRTWNNDEVTTEVNLRRGQVLGSQLRIEQLEKQLKEAEARFELALEYQREKDAQLVESMPHDTSMDYDEERTLRGEIIITRTYVSQTFHEDVAARIRKGT